MILRPPLHRVLGATLLGALFGGSTLLGARPALADESAASRLFGEGRALVIAERFAEACPKFEESQRLEPRLGTQLNVAFCHERLGKIATAWLGFQEAVISARREGDVAREEFASGRVDALEARVPWLRVQGVAGVDVDALTIRLDDAPLAPGSWGKELPVDPGEHAVVAAHVGEEYWRATVVLGESQHLSVAIPGPSPASPAGVARTPAQPLAAPRAGAAEAASARDEAPRAGRFVFELGAFAGYLLVDTNRSDPEESLSDIQYTQSDIDGVVERHTCETAACDYDSLGVTSGFVAGVSGFAGYGVTPSASLGVRFLLGPRAGGGALVALGPSASLPVGERFRVGPTVFFGSASHVDSGLAVMEWSTGQSTIFTQLRATLGLALGLGAELGMTLVSNPTGSVVLQATPLIVYGSNGMAFSLPLGAAYHWN